MFRVMMMGAGALLVSACVSNVENPVSADVAQTYSLSAVTVRLAEDRKVPDRYDTSVMALLDDEEFDRTSADRFRVYAEGRGGLTEDNAGELFLEFLVADEIVKMTKTDLMGPRPASLEVTVADTIFPNTATMMLVGEIIGIGHEFEFTDEEGETVVVSSADTLRPVVQVSAGATGGLLGLALRGGGANRHLMDLQRLANAVAGHYDVLFTQTEISEHLAKQVEMGEIPAAMTNEGVMPEDETPAEEIPQS